MRTLNDITPPSRRNIDTGDPSDRSTLRLSAKQPHFPLITLIVVFLVMLTSVGVLYYFSSVSVNVTANAASASVQGSFTANQSTGALPYEIVTAQKVATQSVKGSGTKAVNASASGTITIYNTQTKAQHLVANTRFATTAGIIFRIRTAVTVPGGSTTKPGSVTTKVYADQPGSAFNVGPSSFTIPGFAGTPQATQVYARSAAPITGGSSGNEPVVDAAIEEQTRAALKKALATDLLASLQTQIPPGYVLIDGAATTTYEQIPSTPSASTGMVDVKEQGTIRAVVFSNAQLANAVAGSVLGLSSQKVALTFASTSALRLSTAAFPEVNAPSFTFSLSGTAQFVYTVDSAMIAAAVAGKTRSEAQVALSNYPEVKRAVLTLRPFWRQTFPQDPGAITVTIEKP